MKGNLVKKNKKLGQLSKKVEVEVEVEAENIEEEKMETEEESDSHPGEDPTPAPAAPPPTCSSNSNKLTPHLKNLLKKRLQEENDFIGEIMELIHIPRHRNPYDDDDDEEEREREEGSIADTLGFRKGGNANRAGNVQELQERFRNKLNQLRGGLPEKSSRKKKLTKLEMKIKLREEKKLKAKLNAANVTKPAKLLDKKMVRPVKPVYNSEGKMVFSKFDFSEDGGIDSSKKTKLDPKAALKKLQSHKEKMESLKEIGKTDRVKNLEEKSTWKNVMDKAEGVKVKDDEGLLKKSIKKIEQKKKSTKKKWDSRKESEDKRKDFKQKKRTENIQKRKKEVKANKTKKAAKKGRTKTVNV